MWKLQQQHVTKNMYVYEEGARDFNLRYGIVHTSIRANHVI